MPPAYHQACCASTASRSARAAATTSRSTCRPRRIRSAASRATSSRTSSGSADSASPRIRIRPRPSCAGATGTRRSTASSWSISIRAGERVSRRPAGGSARQSARHLSDPARRNHRPSAGRSTVALARWESLTRRRRVVALAGADAHAQARPWAMSIRATIGSRSRSQLRGVVSHAVDPRAARQSADRRRRGGRSGLADGNSRRTSLHGARAPSPPRRFSSSPRRTRRGRAQAGDELRAGGPVTLRVRSNAPRGLHDVGVARPGGLVGDRTEQDFTVDALADPAVYRVEVRGGGSRAPLWLLSNPIYVRGVMPTATAPARPPARESKAAVRRSAKQAGQRKPTRPRWPRSMFVAAYAVPELALPLWAGHRRRHAPVRRARRRHAGRRSGRTTA